MIAFCSGKGGAGKSEIAKAFADGLTELGYKVGILDADVDNPNQPEIQGCGKPPVIIDEKAMLMEPVIWKNVQLMSVGFSIPEHAPMLLEGTDKQAIVKALFELTKWDTKTDYLVVDCPAGTGTSLEAVFQQPLTGAIVVTNPQDAAIAGAKRACSMVREYDVPYMGIVLNMASLVCPHCHVTIPFPMPPSATFSPEEIICTVPFDVQIRDKPQLPQYRELTARILKVEGRNLYHKRSKKLLLQHSLMQHALEKLSWN